MRLLSVFMVPTLLTACNGDKDTGDASGDPTWHQDVAPIVAEKCGTCHTDKGIAPFALDEYAVASSMGDAMLAALDAGTMPPWFAIETEECDPMLPYEGDLRLSDSELEILRAWVDAGSPEGDESSPADIPEAQQLFIADPDKELVFPEAISVEGDTDQFVCIVLDPGIDEMKWVTEIQLAPDNETVDHHAIIAQDVNGTLADGPEVFDCFNIPDADGYQMATWVPGAVPMKTPENAAMPLYPDSRIIVQMHYHPTGQTTEFDQSKVQIVWQDEQPEWAAAQALIGNDDDLSSDGTGLQPGPNDRGDEPEFFIPAGAKGHTETILYTQSFPIEVPLFAVGTHMHYIGTDMKIEYLPAGGDEECLIQTPWDFDWQRVYSFDVPIDEMPTMAEGDSLRMRCTYDNSMDNPAVAAALAERGLTEPQDIYLGEETLDEMCLGLFGILIQPALIGELF